MISKSLGVSIFGQLSDMIYSGYLESEGELNRSVYVLSRKKPFEFFHGIVIAVATIAETGAEKLILAPRGEIFYEPEIIKTFKNIKNVHFSKIVCLFEKSCGAVVFSRENDEIRILLVRNHNSKHWSFPKGHVEYGEAEKFTAKREIKEETNLDVKIFDGFREETDYCPFGKIRKRVVFFLAESKTSNVRIQESEINSYIWVTPAQAHKLCSYENDHKLIDKTVKFISDL